MPSRSRRACSSQRASSVEHETSARPPSVAKPEKGTRLSAVEIHDNILAGGAEDTQRPAVSLLWSALASGMLTFTENTLEPVLPLLHERSLRTLKNLLRLWALLLAGNIAGAAIMGGLLASTPAVPTSIRAALDHVAEAGTSGGFGSVFYWAVFAGWLMALMAWLLGATTTRGAQIAIIWLCAAPIGAFEFAHAIAGAVEAFYRAFAGLGSWGDMIGGFVVPAVLGNTIGGVVLVALLDYAQVQRELPQHPRTAS